MLNREARPCGPLLQAAPFTQWKGFGPVTHCKAAEALAEQMFQRFGRDVVEIQTRCTKNPDAVFTHLVYRKQRFVVIPLREDRYE